MHRVAAPCDWLISNLCYQAIEQVYLINVQVSVNNFQVYNIIYLYIYSIYIYSYIIYRGIYILYIYTIYNLKMCYLTFIYLTLKLWNHLIYSIHSISFHFIFILICKIDLSSPTEMLQSSLRGFECD